MASASPDRTPSERLLILALDLNTAAACVAEATSHLVELLRARPEAPSPRWQHDYATSCEYFKRAHKRYLGIVATFASELSRTKGSAANPVTEDQNLARALAATRRIAETTAALHSLIGETAVRS